MIRLQDAIFCPYCGEDIKTLRDKAYDAILALRSNKNIVFMSEVDKSEYFKNLDIISNYINQSKEK